MLELYVWGSENEVAKFCPESIASTLFIKSAIKDQAEYKIIPSAKASYYDCCLYNFPFLRDRAKDDVVKEGYVNIIKYIKKVNPDYDIDHWLRNNIHDKPSAVDDEAWNIGLTNHMSTKLNMLSYYNHLLHNSNYNKFTVNLWKFYLPFPLQYFIPPVYRKVATDKCGPLLLSPLDSSSSYNDKFVEHMTEKMQRELNLPSLGAIHTEHQKKMLKNLHLLREYSTNYKILALAQECITKVDVHQNFFTSDNDTASYLFGDKITSCDFLLIANIISAIGNKEQLPDTFLNDFFELRYPGLVKLANLHLENISF